MSQLPPFDGVSQGNGYPFLTNQGREIIRPVFTCGYNEFFHIPTKVRIFSNFAEDLITSLNNIEMAKFRLITCLLILAAWFVPQQACAQLDLFNKKEYLSDFNNKTLMVVLENNSLADLALKEAVEKKWELSNYQFCSLEEFDRMKTDTSYYFLVRVKGVFKKEREPAIEFLSLLKGAPEAAKGLDQMPDILSLPFQAADDEQGYILPYVNSYLNVIQAHVLRIQRKKLAAHIGLAWYANRLGEIKDKQVLINEEELAENFSREEAEKLLKNGVHLVEPDVIEKALDSNSSKTLVTLCIAPGIEQQGSFCYKMLLSADGSELFYYKKQKVNAKNPKGFSREDVKAFVFYFK